MHELTTPFYAHGGERSTGNIGFSHDRHVRWTLTLTENPPRNSALNLYNQF